MKSLYLLILFFSLSFTSNGQCWKAITCGEQHCMALKTDGRLYGWGGNTVGEVGYGNYALLETPVLISTDLNWDTISAGAYHTLAIRNDGTLWVTGYNSEGQLGLGLGNSTDGFTQVGTANDWSFIAAGDYHSFAIKSNGSLWATGTNANHELGNGSNIDEFNFERIGWDNDWVYVCGGQSHSLAIKSDGTLWSWGSNAWGESQGSAQPTQLSSDTTWKMVQAGTYFSIGLKKDSTLWGWGNNMDGMAGLGATTNAILPTQIGTSTDWVTINTGYTHSLALRNDGTLWGWGANSYSRVTGDNTFNNQTTPVQIGSATDWDLFAAGIYHSMGTNNNGDLYAWGGESRGQLANGTAGNMATMGVVQTCATVGVEDENQLVWKVFPNPATDRIAFEGLSNESINLYSIDGKLVLSTVVNGNSTIDISGLEKGIYLIQTSKSTIRLVKQ